MKKDTETTKVVFRKYPDGDIIAIFSQFKERNGDVTCYQHIGQHGVCDATLVVGMTKLATPDEYAALQKELGSIGYNLKIQKRINR